MKNSLNYKLSPSDFAFLWEQCKRCFYLKVVHGIKQPTMPMAGIFKRIEGLQMAFYNNKHTKEICSDLPAGIIKCGERWVESKVIKLAGHKVGCYISGKVDTLIRFDDKSWGIIDFKTTDPRDEHVGLYSRQLHAYAYALENPSMAQGPDQLKLSPITRLGLLCFEPEAIKQPGVGLHAYEGKVHWIEIKRDDDKFRKFIDEIVALLEAQIPEPNPLCGWCKYTVQLTKKELTQVSSASQDQDLLCPVCGSKMVRKEGRYGPFMSCTKYPACKATRNLQE